jgi:hypothetical protein
MKSQKLLILGVCLLVIGFPLSSISQSVRVGISVDSQESTIGAPVLISMRLLSDADLSINLGADLVGALEILLKDPAGTTRKITLPINKEFHAVGGLSLASNREDDEIITLPADKFTQPGVYGLRITIDSADNPPFEYINPEFLKFTVAPYSEESMRRSCAEFAAKLSVGTTASEWIAYSRALVSVRDPLALPYLKESLKFGFGENEELILAIEKIGSVDAVTILADASHRKDNRDISTAATLALQRLAQNAPDSEARNAATLYLNP